MLVQLNRKAIRARAGRSLRSEYVEKLPVDKLYPISQHFLHNDCDVRCRIVFNEQGQTGELDITLDDFNRVPMIPVKEP
jgi:hypothetical protein